MRFVHVNIANLSGLPSVLYVILGLAVFVRFFALERSLLSGALTMGLLILPIIVISTQEAIRSIPGGIRESAYALGATRWQVTYAHVLPLAAPGIMTGVILSLSRALGETAPLIMIGALTFVAFLPENVMDPFTVLPDRKSTRLNSSHVATSSAVLCLKKKKSTRLNCSHVSTTKPG